MTQNNPQVPWTDEQWARVNQVIHEEANRARVAASFLPLDGPLSGHTDFVRAEKIEDTQAPIKINDRDIIQLATLLVKVRVRGAQMADPEMRSVLALFRRAANVLGRLEDAIVFNGLVKDEEPHRFKPPYGAPPKVWEVHGREETLGLLSASANQVRVPDQSDLVAPVTAAIGMLEARGYFGPFAVVLDQRFFLAAQNPASGLVLPQDRIIHFLGGGPLLRSSTLPPELDGSPPIPHEATGKPKARVDTPTAADTSKGSGVVVALGGGPVELVVARDVSLQFLQLTEEPQYVFRVYEKMALRIKSPQSIVGLLPEGAGVWIVSPVKGPAAGSTDAKPVIINIWGFNFSAVTEVKFGDAAVVPRLPSNGNDFKISLPLPASKLNDPSTGKPPGAGPVKITLQVGSKPIDTTWTFTYE